MPYTFNYISISQEKKKKKLNQVQQDTVNRLIYGSVPNNGNSRTDLKQLLPSNRMNNVNSNKYTYIDAMQQNIPSSNLPKNFLCFCTIATSCPILQRIDHGSKTNTHQKLQNNDSKGNKMDETRTQGTSISHLCPVRIIFKPLISEYHLLSFYPPKCINCLWLQQKKWSAWILRGIYRCLRNIANLYRATLTLKQHHIWTEKPLPHEQHPHQHSNPLGVVSPPPTDKIFFFFLLLFLLHFYFFFFF